jgi:hypothetical protein
MFNEVMGGHVRIGSLVPQSLAGAIAGDYISLKNANRAVVEVSLGSITTSVTIQLRQATAVAGTGAKALNFTSVWRQGGKITMTMIAGTFQVGETVTGGTSAATGIIHLCNTGELVLYTVSGTFQTAETLTGGTSGATATSTSALTDDGLKMNVPLAAAANTIALTIGSQTYEIEVDPASLDVANGFDCIMADVSAAGGTGLVAISYLVKPKYTENPQKSLLID